VNLLLDTHLVLWAAFAPERLSPLARSQILSPEATLWFSVASLWEVAIKRALNRATFQVEVGPLRAGLLSNGYSELNVEGRHVMSLATLPRLHGDPFDRILVAQAMAEAMPLLTVDRMVAAYGGSVQLV
jgi:PIN domain nuclease of toxin-antitoxin system